MTETQAHGTLVVVFTGNHEVIVDHVEVLGLDIAFRRAGQGVPLLLLHGGLCDSRVWRSQLEELGDEFSVVAWDAPGCGESSDPPDSYRLPDYADLLGAFVEALGIERPHVLGHSFGGGLALELYRRHPALPRSLVVAAGYAGWAGSLPAEEVRARLDLALRQADELPTAITPDSVPGLFSTKLSAEQLEEVAAIMSEVRPAGMRTMARGFAEADLRDVLASIDVPTLLLYGDADQRASRAVWEPLHAGIPTSTLVLLPGIGHDLALEAPEAFNAEVRRFIRSFS